MKYIIIWAILLSSIISNRIFGNDEPVIQNQRPVMVEDLSSVADMEQAILSAIDAANTEDLSVFLDHFTNNAKGRIRKKIAILFVKETVRVELIEHHVIDNNSSKGSMAVRYKAIISDNTKEIVSIIKLVNENNSWKIDNEKIYSSSESEYSLSDPFRLK
jgi:hypothetical protein